MAIVNDDDASVPDASSNQDTQPPEDATEAEKAPSNPPEEEITKKYAAEKERAANLHKGLNDKASKLKLAEAEIARLRVLAGEVEEEKPEPSDHTKELQALEWRLENKSRINLVKEEYEEILAKGYDGEKVTERIALELAEKRAKIDTSGTKRGRQDDITTPSLTARSDNPKGYLSDTDRALGLTIEKRRKLEERHPHLREQ